MLQASASMALDGRTEGASVASRVASSDGLHMFHPVAFLFFGVHWIGAVGMHVEYAWKGSELADNQMALGRGRRYCQPYFPIVQAGQAKARSKHLSTSHSASRSKSAFSYKRTYRKGKCAQTSDATSHSKSACSGDKETSDSKGHPKSDATSLDTSSLNLRPHIV